MTVKEALTNKVNGNINISINLYDGNTSITVSQSQQAPNGGNQSNSKSLPLKGTIDDVLAQIKPFIDLDSLIGE